MSLALRAARGDARSPLVTFLGALRPDSTAFNVKGLGRYRCFIGASGGTTSRVLVPE